MNTQTWTVDLDLGEVGWKESHHFAVRLDASRLSQLMTHAALGSRVYELVTIQREGDIWSYVDVMAIDLPPAIQHHWSKACQYQPTHDQRVAFEDFDAQLQRLGEDGEFEREAWHAAWTGRQAQAFVASLYERVRLTVQNLEGLDELMAHELARIRRGVHAYDRWPRAAVQKVVQARSSPPETPSHAPGFYEVLQGLLQRPEIEAVRYRGEGDYAVLRQLCNEQRRRADAQGVEPHQALHLSALCNARIDNHAWNSELLFFDEGLGWGDLHIEGDGQFGAGLGKLVGTPFQRFGRWVLGTKDLGDLPGYGCELGDGWALYTAWGGTSIQRPPREQW